MEKAVLWLRMLISPVRFWFAVAALLVVVYGMSYAYGAWYASLIVQDAVPIREIRSSARWLGQFEFRDLGNGLRERDFHPAPDSVRFSLTRDLFEEADVLGGGYKTFGRVLAELGDEEEEETEEEGEDISYEDWTANLRRTGILLSEPNVANRTLGVAVGEYSDASEARAKVSEFLSTGRHAEVEEVVGRDGQRRYRVVHGAVSSQEELAALQGELESAGLIQSGGGTGTTPPNPDPNGGANTNGASGAGGGGSETPPDPGPGPVTGGGETPPPADPPAGGEQPPSGGEPAGGGRSLTDL